MIEILYSYEAKDDVIGIRDYILEELKNATASKNVPAKITKVNRVLETSPEIGTPLSTKINIETNYRYIVSGNYISFYRYVGGICYIDRVLYGGSDYLAVLFKDKLKITKDNDCIQDCVQNDER